MAARADQNVAQITVFAVRAQLLLEAETGSGIMSSGSAATTGDGAARVPGF